MSRQIAYRSLTVRDILSTLPAAISKDSRTTASNPYIAWLPVYCPMI